MTPVRFARALATFWMGADGGEAPALHVVDEVFDAGVEGVFEGGVAGEEKVVAVLFGGEGAGGGEVFEDGGGTRAGNWSAGP